MLEVLRRCPAMFAITSEGSSTMAKMDDLAKHLVLSAATTSGEFYRSCFGESDLVAIKCQLGEDADWTTFFDVLCSAFNGSCVSILAKSKDTLHVLCCREECAERSALCFPVQKTDEDVLVAIMKGLLEANSFYGGPKEKRDQFQKVAGELERVTTQIELLEDEVRVLCGSVAWRRKQDIKNTLKIGKLSDSIARLQHQSNSKPKGSLGLSLHGESFFEADTPRTHQAKYLRLAFEKEHREYNMDLLRMIKDRWLEVNGPGECNIAGSPIGYDAEPCLCAPCGLTNDKHRMVWGALSRLDEWDYDVFELQAALRGDGCGCGASPSPCGVLLITMYTLMIKYGFFRKFEIDEQVFVRCFGIIEDGYHANPYHNSTHAADVLHITHYLLSKGGLAEICKLDDKQVFAALFAAAIHDYNHPGVNNNFNILLQTYDATLYNDRSILENMHVASVFELMKDSALDILARFPEEHRRHFRSTVIDMILATDMSMHEKYVSLFKRRLGENRPLVEECDQSLALSMALKLADISNCCRPLPLYIKWSEMVSAEFYLQGDRERSLGMPCSPFMNRLTPMLARGQTSFISYIFLPFLELMIEFLPNMKFTVELAAACKSYRVVGNTE